MMRFVTLLGFVLMGAEAANAQTAHVLGVWKLNLSASIVPDWFTRDDDLRSYSLQEDGYLVARSIRTVNGDTPDEQSSAWHERRSRVSAAEIPPDDLPGDREDGCFMYSEIVTDDYTRHIVGAVDGEVSAIGTRRLSEDGATMTLDVTLMQRGQELPVVLVFDRG